MCSQKKGIVERIGHGFLNFGSKPKDEHGNDVELKEAWEQLLKYAKDLFQIPNVH